MAIVASFQGSFSPITYGLDLVPGGTGNYSPSHTGIVANIVHGRPTSHFPDVRGELNYEPEPKGSALTLQDLLHLATALRLIYFTLTYTGTSLLPRGRPWNSAEEH